MTCTGCDGSGKRLYPSTALWRGGVGGRAITEGVCDVCWGSGDYSRPWPSHREIVNMRAQLQETREENSRMRGLLALSREPCVYCGLAAEDMNKCIHGFPGCARADDMLNYEGTPPLWWGGGDVPAEGEGTT